MKKRFIGLALTLIMVLILNATIYADHPTGPGDVDNPWNPWSLTIPSLCVPMELD